MMDDRVRCPIVCRRIYITRKKEETRQRIKRTMMLYMNTNKSHGPYVHSIILSRAFVVQNCYCYNADRDRIRIVFRINTSPARIIALLDPVPISRANRRE